MRRIAHWLPILILFLSICLMGTVTLSYGAPLPPVMLSWCVVYYWAMFRPDSMPLWAVVVMGLVQDVIYGFAMGASAFSLLILALWAGRLRRLLGATHFVTTWLGFGIVCIVLALLMSAIFALAERHDMLDLLGQWFYGGVLTWVAYPLLHGLNNALYKHMAQG